MRMELTIGGRTWPLDPDVAQLLLGAAQVWETPNDTLRRLLGANSDTAVEDAVANRRGVAKRRGTRGPRPSAPRKPRAKAGTILPETQYDQPIFAALVDAGGRLPKSEVIEAVGRMLDDRLLPADREPMGNEQRWEKRVQFRRLKLVQQGLMNGQSPRGIWEITDAGRAAYAGMQRAA
jgi:Mrr N-terminal domain